MCGLAGWLFVPGREPSLDVLMHMATALRHRGPDDKAEFRDPTAGFAVAHRRLSIIDLSADSHQPMIDAATGVVMAYNGELYNFRSLRQQLVAIGHVFRSAGDTEVVLRSFLEWGPACFDRFAGMFAVAFWVPATRTLHLARDATGMKPLYYLSTPEGIVFASEIKAFLGFPGFGAQPDPMALRQYLEFGYVFDLQRTMLRDVHKVTPGHRLEIRNGRIEHDHTWFRPSVPDASDFRDEIARVEELGQLLDDVVEEHLIADVPVGLLLSGGLDSSLLAAIAAKKAPLTTIGMGFAGSAVDERPNAREVSNYIHSEHLELLIHPQDVKDEVRRGAWVFDDLFADWGTITTQLLYRRCREHGLKVILVGEGADELFGGYSVFDTPDPLGLWQQFRLYQRYSGRRHGRLFGQFRSIMQEYLACSQGDGFHAVRLFETQRQLPNQYVMKVDKASMAESVEARAPYLDRRIADYACRTPRQWLLRNGETKYLLRAVARHHNLLPSRASGRVKFGAPLDAGWMDSDAQFRSFARDRLLDPASQTRRLGLDRAMRAYFDEGRTGYPFPAELSLFRNLAWRLLLLELWSDHYLAPGARI
jgi:asparagine synthase (glutamine-hydrolysing)